MDIRISNLAKRMNIKTSIIYEAIKNGTIYKNINGQCICVLCGHHDFLHNFYSCSFNNCNCGGRRSIVTVTMPPNYMD